MCFQRLLLFEIGRGYRHPLRNLKGPEEIATVELSGYFSMWPTQLKVEKQARVINQQFKANCERETSQYLNRSSSLTAPNKTQLSTRGATLYPERDRHSGKSHTLVTGQGRNGAVCIWEHWKLRFSCTHWIFKHGPPSLVGRQRPSCWKKRRSTQVRQIPHKINAFPLQGLQLLPMSLRPCACDIIIRLKSQPRNRSCVLGQGRWSLKLDRSAYKY